jgi:hypothetical protein
MVRRSPVRTLTSVLGNSQRLDGGSMFGNAPKALWQTWIAPDDLNRIAIVDEHRELAALAA